MSYTYPFNYSLPSRKKLDLQWVQFFVTFAKTLNVAPVVVGEGPVVVNKKSRTLERIIIGVATYLTGSSDHFTGLWPSVVTKVFLLKRDWTEQKIEAENDINSYLFFCRKYRFHQKTKIPRIIFGWLNTWLVLATTLKELIIKSSLGLILSDSNNSIFKQESDQTEPKIKGQIKRNKRLLFKLLFEVICRKSWFVVDVIKLFWEDI